MPSNVGPLPNGYRTVTPVLTVPSAAAGAGGNWAVRQAS